MLDPRPLRTTLRFAPAVAHDAEALVALRIAAMRASLEAIGEIGGAALAEVVARVDKNAKPVRAAARVGSDSNRFYRRHGFMERSRDEFDIHYERAGRVAAPESAAPPTP